ncbi:MAG: hypothetical protein CMJ59_02320 [Planctomycetaceae bacterium]|nr:hypothetical protein [Planctomycetaceae bacterium]
MLQGVIASAGPELLCNGCNVGVDMCGLRSGHYLLDIGTEHSPGDQFTWSGQALPGKLCDVQVRGLHIFT